MQVEIKQSNAVTKQITLTVEAERAMKEYQKYLGKAAREVVVPGFRKGKAPLSMVDRMYADKVIDLFYKEMVDTCFDEASKEHDIHYLLYPEVKNIIWDKNEPMTIEIEIETEPDIEFKQLEGLQIPHKPVVLDEEVDKYIAQLLKENAYLYDVEDAVTEGDTVEVEVSATIESETLRANLDLAPKGEIMEEIYVLLSGKTIGDSIEFDLAGVDAAVVFKNNSINMEASYKASFMVNAIRRSQVPELNDDFAKDLEFDSVESMRAKIAEDMQLQVSHKNIAIQNNAIIHKLFIDNQFPLPERTLAHIAERETASIQNEQWKSYYEYQVKMQIAHEMINLYTLNNLRKIYDLSPTEEDIASYIEHNAILEDKTVEAWKEQNKKLMDSPDFMEQIKSFLVLRLLAEKNEFVIETPAPSAEIEEDELISAEEITEAEETKLGQADIFEEV